MALELEGQEEEAFQLLCALLSRERGLDLSQYKRRYIERRVAVRMRALGLENHWEYYQHLQYRPQELPHLLDELTVNQTGFFRNPGLFRELESVTLPGILAGKRAGERFRVWSAGCATGEEPHSLTMLYLHAFGADAPRLEVVASDLDRRSLEIAEAGVYPVRKLAGLPKPYRQEFTTPATGEDGEESVQIVDPVRERVQFERRNLLTAPALRRMDLVLCRNVLIYFGLDGQGALLQKFAQALRPGGVLVLGAVDRLLGPARAHFRAQSHRNKIFQKVEG